MKPEDHWNSIYSKKPEEELGWYQQDMKTSLRMIAQMNLEKKARNIHKDPVTVRPYIYTLCQKKSG